MERVEDEPGYSRKNGIDQFIIGNNLNYSIYEILLSFREKYNRVDIFNLSYYISDTLQREFKPELRVDRYFEKLCSEKYNEWGSPFYHDNIKSKEFSCIVISCVYVILFHSESSNKRIPLCLIRIKGIVEPSIFNLFEHLTKKKKTSKDEKQIPITVQYEPTQYDIFMEEVEKYHFSELPKLKVLTEEKRGKLVKKLVESIPYAIAMLTFLEYPDYLKSKYKKLHTKESRYTHIAKALNTRKDTVKGHFIAIDNPKSKKADIYKAPQFISDAQKDYEDILNK